MSVSVRTRFEVFKRDRFTCSYCGRTPPEVLLEADHIMPKAAGGSDDITNLTTACATCNSGKAARLLEEGTAPVVGRATIEEIAERLDQARAYMEVLGGMQAVVERQWSMFIDAWADAFGAQRLEDGSGSEWSLTGHGNQLWPNEHSVKRFLRHLTLENVLDAVLIAASKMNSTPGRDATMYFYGVCNRSIKEGRAPGFGTRQPVDDVSEADEAWSSGHRLGLTQENHRLRDLFKTHEDHGYATLADLVLALWPED